MLQCELAHLAEGGEEGNGRHRLHGKIGVIWAYTAVVCLALLPVASRLGARAERASEEAEEALSELYATSDGPGQGALDGPLLAGASPELGQVNATQAATANDGQ